MLRRNLATKNNLVNGSVGVVKDIIYDRSTDPSSFIMPTSIIVEFEDYEGPPFFVGEGREKWIPLRPQKRLIDRFKKTFRRQFPICLAYAITAPVHCPRFKKEAKDTRRWCIQCKKRKSVVECRSCNVALCIGDRGCAEKSCWQLYHEAKAV